jgi:predicted nucleic acid-binding protein
LIYLDTSLLASLYCLDANSTAAAGALQLAAPPLLITALCELEAVNAFGLRVFRKEITSRQAEASLRNFEKDLRSRVFQLRALPEAAFARARRLSCQTTPQLGTRTADLLHVAAALELGANLFFSFDLQQRKAALAAGLKLNPLP